MKLENQVCTLEQGKKLFQLGIFALPVFCHYMCNSDEDIQTRVEPTGFVVKANLKAMAEPEFSTTWIAPAYTVAELGVMLHQTRPTPVYFYDEEIGAWITDRLAYAYDINDISMPTEAQLKAYVLIRFLEKGYLTAEECNQRLAAP